MKNYNFFERNIFMFNLKQIIMEDLIGKIDNPEQFLDIPKEICVLDNSVEALEFFIDMGYPTTIAVFPVEIELSTIDRPSYLFWIVADTKTKTFRSLIPVFKMENIDSLNHINLSSIKLIDCDKYFVWNGSFYCILLTSKGNFVVKQVNGVFCEEDVKTLISIKISHLRFPSVYPVELFSKSKHCFITAVWAIEDPEENAINWYPICWDDFEKLKDFENGDISMFPLNVGDITRASNITFEVLYNKGTGIYLKKSDKPLLWRHTAQDLRKKEGTSNLIKLNTSFAPKNNQEKPDNRPKGIVIPFNPKRHN